MKTILIKVLLIIITIHFTSSVVGQNLKDHQWKNRILIIQTLDESSKEYINQLDEFKGLDKEFKERKLVVYQIVNDKYLLTDYQKKDAQKTWKTLQSFPKKIGAKKPFKVVLIGLDGGKKLKKTEVLKKEALFAMIDAMPMRRSELLDD